MATDPTTESMDAAARAFAHLREVSGEDAPDDAPDDAPGAMPDLPPGVLAMIERFKNEAEAEKSPMRAVLDRMLAAAAATLGDKQIPAFEAQVWWKDGSVFQGAIRRSEDPGVYVIAAQPMRGNQPIEGKLLELYFHASDLIRLAVLTTIERPKIVLVGDKLFVPQG
jgi:hypothetical protein